MTTRTLVTVDARAARGRPTKVGKATAVSDARSLNDYAFRTMRFERGNMHKRLGRRSRFTISGTQVEKALKYQGVPRAAVFIDDKRAIYLAAHEKDGAQTRSTTGAPC